ncbi:MAG: VPLPA-CTERM sorting domain-containing protein [Gammaproteobacteria bacterium]|nr:VPLPA-CTERM sorting domain-containing protein [Gammaproteobacteria bacterium]
MSFTRNKHRLLAIALAVFPLAAPAALVDFDLLGWGMSEPLVVTSGDLSLAVTASGDALYQTGFLGVSNAGPAAGLLVGDGESLTFDFGAAPVALARVNFSGMAAQPAAVRIYGDGDVLGDFAFTAGSAAASGEFEARGWLARTFTFAGFDGTGAGFSIADLTVNTRTAGVGAVPVPNSVWLLASAIGFLGLMRRRRQLRAQTFNVKVAKHELPLSLWDKSVGNGFERALARPAGRRAGCPEYRDGVRERTWRYALLFHHFGWRVSP